MFIGLGEGGSNVGGVQEPSSLYNYIVCSHQEKSDALELPPWGIRAFLL